MQFKNGYLGLMIVVLAVVSTAVASWALSMDVEERETIRYDYVTELTGLFDSEQAPTYITYNPSTNMTGYYTDTSTKYFDGVDATLTAQRSQYRINAAPLSETLPTDVDLSGETGESDTWLFRYWTTDNSTVTQTTGTKHMNLQALITSLGVSGYDTLTFRSPQGSDTTGGFVTFIADSMLRSSASSQYSKILLMKNPALTGTLTYNDPGVPTMFDPTWEASSVSDPIRAASYDSATGYITLYRDSAMTDSVGLFTADNIYVVWEDNGFLGHTITYSGADYPEEIYMTIKNGVSIDG